MTTPTNRIRWWPAAIVAVAGASALGWVWLVGDREGQDRVMLTFPIRI